ncbi:hypothetical protein AI22_29780 [Pseudomonas aeruginosa YL84]|nr:hypothetical protein AI22_29780 [Pseudomonas aeruginosa YL84]
MGGGRRRLHRPRRARQLALHFPDEEIVLVEAQEVGFGTAGRNAGFAIDLPHDIGADDYIGDIATARIGLKLNLAGSRCSANRCSAMPSTAR